MLNGISGWLIFLIVNGLALYSSYCLSGYLNRKKSQFTLVLVAAGLIYFAHITISVLFLGVIARYLNVFSVVISSLLISGLLVYYFRGYYRPIIQPTKAFINEVISQRDYFLYGIILLFLIQLIILISKVIILPPHVWDVFTYHLTPAVEWYQQGMIPHALDYPVKRANGMPLGMTVLSYWFFIFFQHDFLVELPSLLWAVMLVPVCYAILRQSGVGLSWSFKFSIVVFFIPIVLMQAVTAKDHLGLNIGFVAALLYIFSFLKYGHHKDLIIAAVAFGLVLGYKTSALFYPVVAGPVCLYLAYMNDRGILTERGKQVVLLKTVFTSAFIMMVIGGYWYIRNVILYGRLQGPFPPKVTQESQVSSAGFQGLSGQTDGVTSSDLIQSVLDIFQFDKLSQNIERFFPRIFDYQSTYGADLPGISGFGPQFVAFGFIAILMLLMNLFVKKYRNQPINIFPWSAVILLLIYFSFYFSANNYRVLSFFPIMMITYAAVVLHNGDFFKNKISTGVINLTIIVSILWSAALILPPQYTNNRMLKEFISLDSSGRTSANFTSWFSAYRPSLYRFINVLPPDIPIAMVLLPYRGGYNEDTWTYPYYDRNWKRRIVYIHQPKAFSWDIDLFFLEDSEYLKMSKYLNCDRSGVCQVTPLLKRILIERSLILVSTCAYVSCLKVSDPDFIELTPGFYYFRGPG